MGQSHKLLRRTPSSSPLPSLARRLVLYGIIANVAASLPATGRRDAFVSPPRLDVLPVAA
jgi:hypothetical protein